MRKAWCVLAVLLVGVGISIAQSEGEDSFGAEGCEPDAVATPEAPAEPRIWIDADPEATEAMLRKLREERVNEASFEQTPFVEVMEAFEREHGIVVHIDVAALDDIGLGEDEPITFRAAKGMPIGGALSLMLQPLDLTYVARGGG